MLYADNCTAHNDLPLLQNVNVQFLPPNTTSVLQPLDQGIIKNLKVHYRKRVVEHILSAIENDRDPAVNLLQAMRMASMAWDAVTPTTISTCFKKCGFPSSSENENDEVAQDTNFPEVNDEEAWNKVCSALNVTTTFQEYVDVDLDVDVVGTLSDDEIIREVSTEAIPDDDDESDDVPIDPPIPRKAALQYFTELSMLDSVHRAVQQNVSNTTQTKITSFFAQPKI